MVLHLCKNGNFVEDSFKTFEKYYPEQNIMVSLTPAHDESAKIHLDSDRFFWINYRHEEHYSEILSICERNSVDKIVLHSIFPSNISVVEYLKQYHHYTVYWLFWGFELYDALSESGRISFLDEHFNPFIRRTYFSSGRVRSLLRKIKGQMTREEMILKASKLVDYFCFWFYSDYQLMQDVYHTPIKFKFFGYVCRSRETKVEESFNFPNKENRIMINHQASVTGNHLTIMKKIHSIDTQGQYSVLVPLSYGQDVVRNTCLKYGKKYFGDKFEPLVEYMNRDAYFQIIDSSSVAIFGQKRQEATGNVGRLLITGTKVFLREDNPLLKYYRNLGYTVFSFEKDLNNSDDLLPLSSEIQIHNRKVWYKNLIYYEDFMPSFFKD